MHNSLPIFFHILSNPALPTFLLQKTQELPLTFFSSLIYLCIRPLTEPLGLTSIINLCPFSPPSPPPPWSHQQHLSWDGHPGLLPCLLPSTHLLQSIPNTVHLVVLVPFVHLILVLFWLLSRLDGTHSRLPPGLPTCHRLYLEHSCLHSSSGVTNSNLHTIWISA